MVQCRFLWNPYIQCNSNMFHFWGAAGQKSQNLQGKCCNTSTEKHNLPRALTNRFMLVYWVKLDMGHMQSEAAIMAKAVSLCTFSLDWISRDFLLAKTCRWLETWRKPEWRKEDLGEVGGKEEGMWLQKEVRVDSAGTHLDARLVFSYPFTCQNLNVTRHLRGQGFPH